MTKQPDHESRLQTLAPGVLKVDAQVVYLSDPHSGIRHYDGWLLPECFSVERSAPCGMRCQMRGAPRDLWLSGTPDIAQLSLLSCADRCPGMCVFRCPSIFLLLDRIIDTRSSLARVLLGLLGVYGTIYREYQRKLVFRIGAGHDASGSLSLVREPVYGPCIEHSSGDSRTRAADEKLQPILGMMYHSSDIPGPALPRVGKCRLCLITLRPGVCQQRQERTLLVTLEDCTVVYLPF